MTAFAAFDSTFAYASETTLTQNDASLTLANHSDAYTTSEMQGYYAVLDATLMVVCSQAKASMKLNYKSR